MVRFRSKLTYANVMSTLAVFLVLGGGAAFAAKSIVTSTKDVAAQSIVNSDVKKESLKSNRLKNRAAVGDQDVIANSLTGAAIDESTLSLTAPPSGPAGGDLAGAYPNPDVSLGAVGEGELADRQRQIVITPQELMLVGGTPTFGQSFSTQSVQFDPSANQSVAASTEVPVDRAPGSDLDVRLYWDANATANDATWNVGFRTFSPGEVVASPPSGVDVVSTTSPTITTIKETPVLTIPAAAVDNGDPLALLIARKASDPSDTLTVFAFLRLVEIRYTATG